MWRCSSSLALLLASCFAGNALRDPVEPVMMAVTNRTGHIVYLPMTDATSVVGAAVEIRQKGKDTPFRPINTCSTPMCDDGCQVSACASSDAVRALLPDETYSFVWNPFRFDDITIGCADGVRACLAAHPAGDGRYTMTVCFGAGLRPSSGATSLSRRPDDNAIIDGAVADDIACAVPFEFGVPGWDVRYQVTLR